jgi:hypothetical protein
MTRQGPLPGSWDSFVCPQAIVWRYHKSHPSISSHPANSAPSMLQPKALRSTLALGLRPDLGSAIPTQYVKSFSIQYSRFSDNHTVSTQALYIAPNSVQMFPSPRKISFCISSAACFSRTSSRRFKRAGLRVRSSAVRYGVWFGASNVSGGRRIPLGLPNSATELASLNSGQGNT